MEILIEHKARPRPVLAKYSNCPHVQLGLGDEKSTATEISTYQNSPMSPERYLALVSHFRRKSLECRKGMIDYVFSACSLDTLY